MMFEYASPVMEIIPLAGCNLCTTTETVLFCGTAIDVRSFFFPRNMPFPTLVVFLTIHDTLLTALGQRTFFLRWVSIAVDTM